MDSLYKYDPEYTTTRFFSAPDGTGDAASPLRAHSHHSCSGWWKARSASSETRSEERTDTTTGTGAFSRSEPQLAQVPSPAQKGGNTVRVKLTDPAGKPIVGADVEVTFFMAAMPQMNMAEMKTVIKGTDKGGGMYEGKGDLGSGGMWQVTVTAKQKGQTIATGKLTVKAEGGA